MRILQVGSATSSFIKIWSEQAAARGHDVHIASFQYADIRDATVHLLPAWHRYLPAGDRISAFLLKRLADRLQPDMIHAHYTTQLGYLAALAGLHPVVLQAWGSDILVESAQNSRSKQKSRCALANADIVVAASQYLVDVLKRRYSITARCLQIGIDLDVFRISNNSRPHIVFSARHDTPHYRIGNIREAAKLAGIRIVQADDNLSPADMAKMYQHSVCTVSVPYTDQFSSCLQEAMACGCIPIVADLPAYREHLKHGHNARMVTANAIPEDIARQIIWCLKHDLTSMRNINKKIAEREFDINRCMDAYNRLYEEVAG